MSDHECVNPDANCGTRCDSCDERMCADFGPEPAITCEGHDLCTDCATGNTCVWCKDARGQR